MLARFSRSKLRTLRIVAALCLVTTGLSLAASTASSASGLNILTNGGFESGSFTPGWTTDNAGSGSWGVTSTGASSFGTNAPIEGDYDALFNMTLPASGVLLSNAFTVPAGSTLSLDFAYANNGGGWAQSGTPYTLGSANQWIRVDVISASAAYNSLAPSDILTTLFNSQAGSPALTQGWTTLSASLASLAGQSVEIRVATVNDQGLLPVWVDGVDVTGNLPSVTGFGVNAGPAAGSLTGSWAPSGSATGYRCTLMYGFTTPSTYTVTTTGPSCTFSGLAPGSTWGIQVVATADGLTSAPVLAFGTVPVPVVAKPRPKTRSIVCRENNGKRQRRFTGVNPSCPSGWHRV
jgi:hypothetical protein